MLACALVALVWVSSFLDSSLCLMVEKMPRGPFLDFYRSLTELGKAYLYLQGSFLAWIGFTLLSRRPEFHKWRPKLKDMTQFAQFSFLAFVTTGLLTALLKFFVGRSRPTIACSPHVLSPISFDHIFQSFPSGHTQTVFTFALLVSAKNPSARALAFLFAILIAGTRLARNVHFLSDVLGGIVVAMVGFWITEALFNRRSTDGN